MNPGAPPLGEDSLRQNPALADEDDRYMKNWLREPLLHFLVIGAALFGLYRLVSGEQQGPREIVVSEAQIEALAENFARTWMRPPTAAEIHGLVDEHVKEEIYYREAMAIGLDRDDTVIRRRLRQKLEFVSDDLAATREPTDAELEAYLGANTGRFEAPPSISFEQVYFSGDRRGEAAVRDASRALGTLSEAGSGHAPTAGDPSLLPVEMTNATPRDIANVFGEAFAADIEDAPVDRWVGPVESPFGAHLVRVSARVAGRIPPLDEIRAVVLREWQVTRQEETGRAFYDGLRRKYDVRIEGELGELMRRQAGRDDPAAPHDGRS